MVEGLIPKREMVQEFAFKFLTIFFQTLPQELKSNCPHLDNLDWE